MCGICGKVTFDRQGRVSPTLLGAMLNTIRHRGPDDEGIYTAPQVGLGHRRLSIIDLNTGHQPLSNEDGTVWIVFNGEIYNYAELRDFLVSRGHIFRTKTDTEVIVHLYEEFGSACLERLRGMFAFAIWDENTRTLFAARDRVGIKPLYYHLSNKSLIFASEIKAILADEAVEREIAPETIDRFLTFSYLPGEETLFKNIRKLAPGHYMLHRDGKTDIHEYWDLDFSKPAGAITAREAEGQLLDLLSDAVHSHMIADVPVGVLLSGGVDSTAVLSFAAERAEQVSTFTVGFSHAGLADERPYAQIAAEQFNTQHHEMTMSPADFAAFLPKYVWHMEEPVCEPPAVALYYVSKLAREHVKVLLSGEGGDEAFAGYSNYRNLLWLERFKRGIAPFNGIAAQGLSIIGSMLRMQRVAKYVPLMTAKFPDYYGSRTSYASGYSESSIRQLYSADLRQTTNNEYSFHPLRQLQSRAGGLGILDQMLYLDTKSWLPDDLLIKADKMTMANSVELRVPLLDHRVLEYAASLPANLKVRGLTTKYIARKALGSRVPKAILRRPKVGFPVPYESWLRKDLKSWVREILFDQVTTTRGYFDPRAVRALLDRDDAMGGCSKTIFSLLTLELCQRTFLDTVTPAYSHAN